MNDSSKGLSSSDGSDGAFRLEYSKPELRRYGQMKDLTHAMAGSVCSGDNDGGTGDGTCHDATDKID